ncbi:MAG TPA: lipopolysaccharide kinase InaA family protein [Candidatus Binataceae bacterium]|nr:lipopolysaccharide kinase InaA family protein [Candidatus Binataceae bacterium]
MGMRILYASSARWAELGERLEAALASPDFRRLKETRRTLAGFLRVESDVVFVKRVECRPWLKGLAERVRGSRAKRALGGAEVLSRAGFAHPRPLAAFERRHYGAVRASYLVTEALQRPRVLSRFALSDGRNFTRRQWISQHLALEIRHLHESGCYTRDLQETNLMLEAHGRDLTVFFIDLEDFRRFRKVPQRLRMLNLIHLDRSIGRFVSRSRRLRFLYSYLGGKPSRVEARETVAQLTQIRRRIERRRNGERGGDPVIRLTNGHDSGGEVSATNPARN